MALLLKGEELWAARKIKLKPLLAKLRREVWMGMTATFAQVSLPLTPGGPCGHKGSSMGLVV